MKGGHEDEFPIAPDVLEALRSVYRQLEPEPDDHVFTVERHLFVGNRRVVKQRDPKRPASTPQDRRGSPLTPAPTSGPAAG